MGKLLVLAEPYHLDYESFEDESLAPDGIRIKTLYSGISAGTELAQYRGTSPFLHKRWDVDRRLFVPDEATSLTYPVRSLGYEEVGEVVEVGPAVEGVTVGQRVFGTWGHRTHYVAAPDYVLPRLMPDGLDPVLGIFSHLGAIALNGVHDGRIRIGETVVVFGLGALGQIVVQAARQSGAHVIAVDLHASRRGMAAAMGAHVTLDGGQGQVAEAIKDLTGGRGADVCFEVTGSTRALNEAIRSAAYSARVVAMGFFQGEAQGLFLGEEFHHNRINVVCSQISGSDPELKYRWDKMRLWQTAIRLQAEGTLDLRPLITHTAPFGAAAGLFDLLDRTPDAILQSVLTFEPDAAGQKG
ncbi:MAG TPA: zinc-binding alcohol dehydrogenase [Aggregatilinea sp.]|uniref:zinc-dependent alcohol dehydrogenase n=1 Tax=Aggregatilinea sp. TaxID=2806333 RepID=UPI002BC54560|nr:zinc-binding alcohol dehydrogenase [Aggregatilinea sp.]HML24183.1 zinc-binding alcohol dehydrogenase [Aggregatilinea sp.]